MFESLVHVPLFQDLEPEHLELIEPLFEYYSCPENTVIFEQNETATHLYLLLRGAVAIRYKPYDGPPITVTHLRAGDVFGWSALVGGPRYTSGIVSEETVEALRIRGAVLRQLCIQHPATGRIILSRLADVVSARWKNAQAQVQSMLDQGLSKGYKRKKGAKSMVAAPQHSQEQQIRGLLEQLDAYVEQYHGGTVDFVSFDGQRLKVRLGGACLGYPLSPATLHGWVAGTVHQFFPDVEVIEEK